MCEYFHKTDLYDCPKCGKKLRDFKAELRAKVDAVPREVKQKFVDYLREGNIGQAIEKIDPEHKIEDIVWFNIVSDQIEVHRYETFNPTVK